MLNTAHLATRSVRYLQAGSGPAVLLLHAFPLNAEQWLPQLSKGVPGWTLIAPDLRGFGPVEPVSAVAGGASIDRHAADLLELMSHLDRATAVMAGSSLGAEVALAAAKLAPGRVRALMIGARDAYGDRLDGWLSVLERDGPGGVARELLPGLLSETARREQPDLVEAVRHVIEANTPEGIVAGIRALRDRSETTTPTETRVTETAGSPLENLESPLAFNAALQSFLNGVARTPASDTSPAAGAAR